MTRNDGPGSVHGLEGTSAHQHKQAYYMEFDRAIAELTLELAYPEAVERQDQELLHTCEESLAAAGIAQPNHVSPLWKPALAPRTEAHLREMAYPTFKNFGYRVVVSQTDFPDWLLLDADGTFVFAEAEHRSSSFKLHKHPEGACDLVVCWEHDDPTLRIPVLEVFSEHMYEPENPMSEEEKDVRERKTAYAGYVRARYAVKKRNSPATHALAAAYGRRVAEMVELTKQEKNVSKTEAVRITADDLGIGPSTVWTLLKRSGA